MSSSRTSFILAICWTAGILIACTLPGSSLPKTDIWEFDKFVHAALFAGFGWIWMHSLHGTLKRRILLVTSFGVGYAVLTEIYQGWLPWPRHPDPVDAAADIVGIILAVTIYGLKYRIGPAAEKTSAA